MATIDPSRRRVTVDLDRELVDWLDVQAGRRGRGREVVLERALRDLRRVVERDRQNPRPDE